MDGVDQILNWIGQLALYGGGSVAIAFGAFRIFSEKWLQAKFDERLEQYRHENSKELAKISALIEGSLSARISLQNKQFEIVSEAWRLMHDSYVKIRVAISRYQSVTDLRHYNSSEVDELFASLRLSGAQRREVLDATDPNLELAKAKRWKNNVAAHNKIVEFRNFLYSHDLFLDESIARTFREVLRKMEDVIHLSLYDAENDRWSPETQRKCRAFEEDWSHLIDSLKVNLRARFAEFADPHFRS